MSLPSPDAGFLRVWRGTATRLFALQAAALVLAFALTGVVATVAINQMSERSMREEVLGEAASLDDEVRQKGVDHLPHTVAKRARLWRGFEYGLSDPAGRPLAGDPALSRLGAAGWSRQPTPKGPVLAYTETLPGGGRLSVGRNLTNQLRQTATLNALLGASGLLGVAICLAAAWATTRWTWRRLDELAATAAAVAGGSLDVRAPVRRAAAPDEIDELALAFNGMLDRIARLVDQLRRVTTDVAHDMRRPLTRLRQKLERVARAAADTPAIAAEVRRLDSDFQEILRTFDALLQLAEIEGGARPSEAVDLTEVAGRVAEALRPDIEDSGRFLEARIEPATVNGDSDLIAQALANLLENALRHTPVGTRIDLSVEDGAGAPRLSVRDNGPGVPSALHEAVLAPFGRLEASRSSPGSGLGLAIAVSVAARHGARLELGDAGPGLEVAIVFPATR